MEDFANGLLLLSSLDITLHLEFVILLLQGFQLLLIFDLSLLGSHQIGLKAFASILDHSVLICEVTRLWPVQHSFVLFGVEWSLLDKLIVQCLLLFVLEVDSIGFLLVCKHYRTGL